MSNTPVTDQAIALAGIAQAAMLVNQLAREGNADQQAMQCTIHSILALDAPDSESIFINRKHLHLGLKTVREAFERDPAPSAETLRYCASMLHLQKQLVKNPSMLDALRKRIQQLQKQIDLHGEHTSSQVFSSIASIYSDTLSTFQFRVQVNGRPELLQQQNIADQIRTALFGGVRAAILWRQLGGSRLDFIFRRKAIYNATVALMEA